MRKILLLLLLASLGACKEFAREVGDAGNDAFEAVEKAIDRDKSSD